MLLSKLTCDGCGRQPGILEWLQREVFSSDGYGDWRHPSLAFKEAGVPLNRDTRDKVARLFESLFGRPQPDELSFLCPQCQDWVARELPGLAVLDDQQNTQTSTQLYNG